MSWLSRILGSGKESEPARGDPRRVLEVEAVLRDLRPMLALDGGDFELVAVEDEGDVVLRAKGSCVGCHAQATTLSQALEARLRERCPWLSKLRTED
jgi:Fe-S cluster biogenesis protein NfuA